MISIGYVNNTLTPMTDAFFKEYTAEINDLYDDINFTCCEMALVEERVDIEQEITGSVNDTLMLEYEEKKKNFFQKIGEAIITIFEKVRAAIQSAIDKVKEIAFGSKSDLQKLDALIKKHPELKDEVVCAFNSGALDMKDIKSLKELDAAFEEVMRMSKEKDIDPNTLKGKWEKAKKKFQEDEKTWKIVKVGAAATTVITAIKAIATFNGVLRKNRDMLQESNAKNNEIEAELEKRLRDEGAITAADPSTGKGGTGKWTALLQINRERNGYHDAARMKNLSLLERMQNGVAKVLDKFTSSKQKAKLFSDYETERRIKDAKKTQDHDDQVSLAADIETAKQNAQKPFKDADYKQHRKDQQDDYKQHRKDQQDDYKQHRKDQQDKMIINSIEKISKMIIHNVEQISKMIIHNIGKISVLTMIGKNVMMRVGHIMIIHNVEKISKMIIHNIGKISVLTMIGKNVMMRVGHIMIMNSAKPTETTGKPLIQ